MLNDDDFPLRVLNALVECVQRVPENAMKKGVRIADEMELHGAVVAQVFLKTGVIPCDPVDCVALFPRLWYANSAVQNALVHQMPFWVKESAEQALAALLLDTWPSHGRAMWENPPMENWAG